MANMHEKILAAANALESSGELAFSEESLAVAAWKSNQQTFGLRGFETTHLDFHRVYASLCGSRGVIAQGLLSRVDAGPCSRRDPKRARLLELTPKGRRIAEDLLEHAPELDEHGLTHRERAVLAQAMRSRAWRLYGSSKTQICYPDALEFWAARGCAGSTAQQIAAMSEVLEAMESKVEGHALAADVRVLGHLHRWLQDRFASRLSVGVSA